jgi:hypothetical protein
VAISAHQLVLFGRRDVEDLMAGRCGFTDLLSRKIDVLVKKRKPLIDGEIV